METSNAPGDSFAAGVLAKDNPVDSANEALEVASRAVVTELPDSNHEQIVDRLRTAEHAIRACLANYDADADQPTSFVHPVEVELTVVMP